MVSVIVHDTAWCSSQSITMDHVQRREQRLQRRRERYRERRESETQEEREERLRRQREYAQCRRCSNRGAKASHPAVKKGSVSPPETSNHSQAFI